MDTVTIHHPRHRVQADVPVSAAGHWANIGWQPGPLPPDQPAPEPAGPAQATEPAKPAEPAGDTPSPPSTSTGTGAGPRPAPRGRTGRRRTTTA